MLLVDYKTATKKPILVLYETGKCHNKILHPHSKSIHLHLLHKGKKKGVYYFSSHVFIYSELVCLLGVFAYFEDLTLDFIANLLVLQDYFFFTA